MRYNVIAIEREYASGGHEIGEQLALKLGIPCYSQEILKKAAVKMDMPLNSIYDLEESITSSLLYSLSMFADITAGKSINLTNAHKLAIAEAEIIQELALNPCIIIGRGSAGLFSDNDKVLKAFVYADRDARIKRAIEVYGINPNQAETVLKRFDKRRSNYFKASTNMEWKYPETYNMFLNSSKLGIDLCTDILYSAVK